MASANKKTAPASDAGDASNENNSGAPAAFVRAPVVERGPALAALIAAAGGLFLTQDEAGELVAGGFASVDTTKTEGECAFVTLTDAGTLLNAPAATQKAAKPVFEIETVPMPEVTKKRSGKRGSKYPFEKLEVGQSFHVPKSKDMPNPVSALASSLTGARRKFSTPEVDAAGKPVTEAVVIKTYAKDKDGKRIKNGDGKFVVASETKSTRPKMIQQRDFAVFPASPDDPKGAGARVFRTK